MSSRDRVEHCRHHNPFDRTWVTGPYDQRVLPEAPELMSRALDEIDGLLLRHVTHGLAMPVVPIVGNTGYGKTYLLRHLVKSRHQARSHLMVNIQPEEVLSIGGSANHVAEHLLQVLDPLMFDERVPWLGAVRPIDVYARNVIHQLSTKPGSFEIPGLLFGRAPVPVAIHSLIGDAGASQRVDALQGWSAKRALKMLADQAERDLRPFPELNACLLRAAAGLWPETTRIEGVRGVDALHQLCSVAGDRGMPVVFVFDQFEDLSINPEKGSVHDALRAFMLRLNNLVGELLGRDGPPSRLPLFLLCIRSANPTLRAA